MYKKTLKRIASIVLRYKFSFALSLICAFLYTLSSLAIPLFTGRAIDHVISECNVDFTAQMLATTCTITIKEDGGPAVNNTGGDDYSMTIPTVGLDKIANAHADAQANFQLVAKDCSEGYSKIITKLS